MNMGSSNNIKGGGGNGGRINGKSNKDAFGASTSLVTGGDEESLDIVGKDGQSGQAPQGTRKRELPSKFPLENMSRNLVLAYRSLGVVYGDLSTAPLYVYRSIFDGKLQDYRTPEALFGSFSLIFWTITLIPLFKYVFIVLCADDNGEGGSFALYSLLCRHTKFSLLPNQQAADEELSSYRYGYSGRSTSCLQLKRFLGKHKKSRTILLGIVLLAACMVVVISSMSGIKEAAAHLTHGTEAMYADLGHFSAFSMRIIFAFVVYPCLVIQYMGQAAFLSKNIECTPNSFYSSIPRLACMTVMFITTFLMTLVIIFVWQRSLVFAASFLLFFWFMEGLYLSSAVIKAPQGGWASLLLSLILLVIMLVWHYGTRNKYKYDLHNKVPLKWILGLGPSLGIVRVPGIGLIYSELVTGVPPIFSHFVTNLPAFHNVLVFVCVKTVPVPYVSSDERFLIGRVGPRPYCMYRCIVRYGYKDEHQDGNFEDLLIQSLAEFIQMDAVEPHLSSSESSSLDGRMAVISTHPQSNARLIISDEDFDTCSTIQSSKSLTLQSLRSSYDDGNPENKKRRVRFNLPENSSMDPEFKDELLDLLQAKEAGTAYIMGHSYVKARRSSSYWKKLVIDVGYSFLLKNCRASAVALNIPHISLIKVGMIYYV
ncbi:unnamed protein product [Withania somnifera]